MRTTVRAYSRRVKAVMGSAARYRYRADMQDYHQSQVFEPTSALALFPQVVQDHPAGETCAP